MNSINIKNKRIQGFIEQSKKIESIGKAVDYAYMFTDTHKEYDKIKFAEIVKCEQKIQELSTWLDDVTALLQQKVLYLSSKIQKLHVNCCLGASYNRVRKNFSSIKLPYRVTLKCTQSQVKIEAKGETSYKAYMKQNNYTENQEIKYRFIQLSEKNPHNENKVVVDSIKAITQERKFGVK